MAILTLEELQKKHPNAIAKKVFTLEQIQSKQAVDKATAGNQFTQLDERGRKLNKVAGFFGGKELARGLGMSLAAPSVQKDLTAQEKQLSDQAFKLVKKINENKKLGKDTSRLEKALVDLKGTQTIARDVQKDFVSALPSSRQVIGSSLRLGATAGAGVIGGALSKLTALGKATGVVSGAVRGLATGAGLGAVEGAAQGFGLGLEEDKTTAEAGTQAAIGAGLGAVTGGVIGGVTGGIVGAVNRKNDPNKILEYVTPNTNELTPKQYERALNKGLVTPKTATSPAQYKLPEAEREIAFKYADLVDKDPVQTTININSKIGELDDEVGQFLRQNNGIFSKGELRNAIKSQLEEVSDITIDDAQLNRAKEKLINNFISKLETNDMETLWQARKNFDTQIDNAFKGSPTVQKRIKVAFRNAVQDFISDRTPDATYKDLMKDMSKLLNLRSSVGTKAIKERGLSLIEAWAKNNPKTAKIVGYGSLIAGGSAVGKYLIPDLPFGGGGGD